LTWKIEDFSTKNSGNLKKKGQADSDDDEDRGEDHRQEAGTGPASISWHKHTVRVLRLLRRTMGDTGPDREDKKDHQIRLDASVVFGYYNYFLGHGYAVDEQLI
jgi:hypothetical protein